MNSFSQITLPTQTKYLPAVTNHSHLNSHVNLGKMQEPFLHCIKGNWDTSLHKVSLQVALKYDYMDTYFRSGQVNPIMVFIILTQQEHREKAKTV